MGRKGRRSAVWSFLFFITVIASSRAEEEFVPLISPLYATAIEGRVVQFEFMLDQAGSKIASARYRLRSSSATAGEDYVDQTGVVSFAPGESRKSIEIQLRDDPGVEGPESILVELSEPQNARFDTSSPGLIVIEDNEKPVIVDLTFKPIIPSSPSIIIPVNDGGVLMVDATEPTTTLKKLRIDGSVDSSFQSALDPSRLILALAQTSEGEWLVGGLGILKLTETGAMHPTYPASLNGLVRTIALQPDGKILLGGPLSTGSLHGVVRLHENGVWDSSFELPADLRIGDVTSIALQPDGRMIVIAVNLNGDQTISALRLNADGTLDPTFQRIPIIAGQLYASRALRQADGKILIYGDMTIGERMGIVRVNADSTVDKTFNPNPNGAVIAAVLDENGSVWIAGSFSEVNGYPRAGIAKLTSGGILDRSFFPGEGPGGSVQALAFRADRIYVGGNFRGFAGRNVTGIARLYTSNAEVSAVEFFQTRHSALEYDGQCNITLRRLGPTSGSLFGRLVMRRDLDEGPEVLREAPFAFAHLDTTVEIPLSVVNDSLMEKNEVFDLSFSKNTPTIPEYQNHSELVVVDDDNRPGTVDLRFTNSVPNTGIPPRSIGVFADGTFLVDGRFKILTNGVWDTNFVGELWGDVRAVDFQSDGKTIIAGRAWSSGVARLHLDGTLDKSFNEPPLSVHLIDAVRVLNDDRIIIGGLFGELGQSRKLGLMRLMPSGIIDRSFAPDDAIRGPVRQVEIQHNNKMIVAGYLTVNGEAFGVLRFNQGGTLDISFHAGNLASATISAIKLQPDGKLLVARESSGAVQPLLFRVMPNGEMDFSFQVLSNASGTVESIALQTDGKIVLGGLFRVDDQNNVVRLLSDGTMDKGFDSGGGPNFDVGDVAINHIGQIALAGWFGSIDSIQSMRFAVLNSDAPLRFAWDAGLSVLTAYPGSQVVLEESEDLRNWSVMRTNVFEGYTEIIDAPTFSPGFIRARFLTKP